MAIRPGCLRPASGHRSSGVIRSPTGDLDVRVLPAESLRRAEVGRSADFDVHPFPRPWKILVKMPTRGVVSVFTRKNCPYCVYVTDLLRTRVDQVNMEFNSKAPNEDTNEDPIFHRCSARRHEHVRTPNRGH